MASVAIRLGTSGKAQVRADLEEIAQSGEAGAKRHARAWLNAANDVDSAMQRQERAIKKLEMVSPGLNATKLNANLGIRDDVGKSAQASASVFGAAYAQMEARAEALLRAVDPVRDAQARFNATIGEARGLVAAGVMGLDDYVTVLRTEQATLDGVTKAHGRAGASTTATGRAFASASPQIQDFFVQVSMGANPMQAFVVQGGQLAGQLVYLEGKVGAVARFLMGGWGIALQVGMMVLAPFVAKLFEGGKAAEEEMEKLRKNAAETALAESAKKAFAATEQGLIAGLRAVTQEIDRQNESLRTNAERLNAQARASLSGLTGQRSTLQGDLITAREDLAKRRRLGSTGEFVDNDLIAAEKLVADLEKRLRVVDAEIASARTAVAQTDANVADETARRSLDPQEAIRRRYEGPGGLIEQEKARLVANRATTAEMEKQLGILRARQKGEEREAAVASSSTRDSDTLTSGQVVKMLRGALPGVHIGSTDRSAAENRRVGGAANSHHLRGNAVDFVPSGGMSSMTKADVRRIFESRGIEIVELLGPGDKGHSDHFHVAWTKGKLALDEFSDAAKRADQDRSKLASLTGEFDPAAAAADRYRESLAEIARLNPANADTLRAGAWIKFVRDRAGAFELPGVESVRPDAEADAVARKKAEDEQERADERRRQFIGGMLDDQAERLTLAGRELELVGANDNVRERELNKLRIILQLQREKVDLNSAEGQRILANAEALDEMVDRLRRQQAIWDEIRGTGEEVIDRLFDPRSAETWGERVKGVLGDIKAELFKLMLLNPIKNWLNGGDAPTLSGVLGKLFGGAKGIVEGDGSVMNPDWFKTMPRIPGLATGTEYTSGGAALVGEFGPEIVSMPRGSRVTPANDTRRLMAGEAPRGGDTYHFTGNLLTPEFWAQVQAGDDAAATRGAAGGSALGQAAGTARSRRRLGRRW